jgi:SAM-dependent methyltransferase
MVDRPDWAPAGTDLDRPSAARMYDFFLGGAHNFLADRQMAEQVIAKWPEVTSVARANREFLQRAVRFLLDQGIDQFLDIGSGIPTAGNVHEIVERGHRGAKVVYVDIDPVAVAHSELLLADKPNAGVVQGDVTRPGAILAADPVRDLLDLSRPVALLLVSLLHFIPDEKDPQGAVKELRDALAPGSYVVISHASEALADADVADEVADMYRKRTDTPGVLRPRDAIMEFFGDFELVEPGLVGLTEWRPDEDEGTPLELTRSLVLAGVGHRP